MAAGVAAVHLPWVCLMVLWARATSVLFTRRSATGTGSMPSHTWNSSHDLEARGLQEAFREHAATVKNTFAALQQPAVLTVAGSIERLLANFLLQARAAAEADKQELTVVNAVLDSPALDACNRVRQNQSASSLLHVVCLDLMGWLPPCPSRSVYLFVKPLIFREAVKASDCGVLMTDLDVVLHHDLVGWAARQWAEKERDGVLLMTGAEGGGCCNTGTVFASKASLPLMDVWVEENVRWYKKDNLGDQAALVAVVANNLTQIGASPQQISLIPKDVVLQECQKCRCSGGCRQCPDGGPLGIHYNCMNTHVNIEHDLSTRGDWSNVDALLGKKKTAPFMMGQKQLMMQRCREKK